MWAILGDPVVALLASRPGEKFSQSILGAASLNDNHKHAPLYHFSKCVYLQSICKMCDIKHSTLFEEMLNH